MQQEADYADTGYTVPTEGTIFWVDTWVLLDRGAAPERGLHVPQLDPGAGRQVTESLYAGYASCNDEAKALLPPEFVNNPAIYVPEDAARQPVGRDRPERQQAARRHLGRVRPGMTADRPRRRRPTGPRRRDAGSRRRGRNAAHRRSSCCRPASGTSRCSSCRSSSSSSTASATRGAGRRLRARPYARQLRDRLRAGRSRSSPASCWRCRGRRCACSSRSRSPTSSRRAAASARAC